MRDDQVMAQALCDWAIKNQKPPESMRKMVEKKLGHGATNLGHMASALWLGMAKTAKQKDAAVQQLAQKVYAVDFEQVFRTVFEGLSVGYSGYQSLGATPLVLHAEQPIIRGLAREFLRWDYTIQALCATMHGRVIMPCGRIRTKGTDGVYAPATDYRMRTILAITNDGWWPPKGIGPKWWADPSSVSARPWKEVPSLPSLIFTTEERTALILWVMQRKMTPTLRALIDPIRVYQVIHVSPVQNGHVAWMERIESYKAGDNTAQCLVWAKGDEFANAVVQKPNVGCVWNGTNYRVNGKPALGYPAPTPSLTITIGPGGSSNTGGE